VGEQRIQGNRNVQIQDVEQSLIQITYNASSHTVPLEPAHVPVSTALPSPARLVRAHSGVVPYVDRGDLLFDLETWVDGPEPFAGHVIEGRGGSGKTKLAVKLCEEIRESDWLCGFLSRIADQVMLDALVQAPTARLVVIDYAENRAEQVEMLLPLLQAKATAEEPVRVLLLVRTGSDRVTNWAERLGNRVDALDATLEGSQVQALEDTPLRVEDRKELFGVASTAFAEWLKREEPTAPPPDLAEDVFENALMVVVAAYLAAHGEKAPSTQAELLDEVLAHERRNWRESSKELGADDALLERIVALATLVNAENETRAAELLRLILDLREETFGRLSRLARWVHDQYPGPRWWNPLEPDLVGEHLVARCFTGASETLRGVLAGDRPEEITRPLEVLARASVTHPHLATTMTSILGEELGRLCEIAVAQAEDARDQDLLYGRAVTVAAAINAAISTVGVDPMALLAAVRLMPPRPDVVMSDLAATLTAKEVETYRHLAAADPATYAPDLAVSLNNLSNRLSDLGRREEALAAIEESVEIRRPLAAANPTAYAPNLAGALNNLSNCLSELGRREEALAAIEESVEAYRPLAAANPAALGPDLAMSLNSLSIRLSELGRREEALAAIEESVEAYRPLAAANPAAYAPALAMSLNNLSIRLSELGRREEALAAIEESVEAYRPLAAANPAAYAPSLAW
jgi:tetratricopeptide (TPR) repeat protein